MPKSESQRNVNVPWPSPLPQDISLACSSENSMIRSPILAISREQLLRKASTKSLLVHLDIIYSSDVNNVEKTKRNLRLFYPTGKVFDLIL
jgi:hypothetical protein